MEQTVRFRIDGMIAADWKEDFQARLRSGPAVTAVKIVPSRVGPEGLAIADIVLAAIITGGAAVVAATIAAVAAVYVAKLGKDKKPAGPPPQNVVVNLIGSKSSTQFKVNLAFGVSSSELDPVLKSIGQLREVSI
jgi:hypothetical protein